MPDPDDALDHVETAPTRNEFVEAMAKGLPLPFRPLASGVLAGYLAGRCAAFADVVEEDPRKLGKSIADYAAADGRQPDPEDYPTPTPTAEYKLELTFRAPLSAGLAATTDIVQKALPKALRRKIAITSLRLSTGSQCVEIGPDEETGG